MKAFDPQTLEALKPLALRYVWWKPAEVALATPGHALAHIMNWARLKICKPCASWQTNKTLPRCQQPPYRVGSLKNRGITGITGWACLSLDNSPLDQFGGFYEKGIYSQLRYVD
jgi:hypothetical protein